MGEPEPPIVFIGGTGRCGTNITKAVLARHPDVAALPFEYRFLIDPDGIVDFYRGYAATWSPFLADRRLTRLARLLRRLGSERPVDALLAWVRRRLPAGPRTLSPRRYAGWRLDDHLPGYSRFVEDLLDELQSFSFPARWVGTPSYRCRPVVRHGPPRPAEELAACFRRFLARVVGGYLEAQGKRVFVEDNTWNILLARELLEIAPWGRVVHVYRDPRDVVASLTRQRWAPARPEHAALWYRDIMRRWREVRAELPAGSLFEYGLEDLVREPEATLRRLCDFAGLAFDPALLAVDLGHAHTGRWRLDLSPADQARVEEIVADEVAALGYGTGPAADPGRP